MKKSKLVPAKLSQALPVFYPENFPKGYLVETEIDPVRSDGDGNYEPCEEEAEFWSVFLRINEKGRECIADVQTKEQAEKLAEIFDRLIGLQ